MQDSTGLRERRLSKQLPHDVNNIWSPSGTGNLIIHNMYSFSLFSQTQHGFEEILSVNRIQPTHPQDQGVLVVPKYAFFSVSFGDRVHIQRVTCVSFSVWPAGIAIENVVGAEVNQLGIVSLRKPGEVLGRFFIEPLSQCFFRFCQIHRRVSRAVDDHLRTELFESSYQSVPRGDVHVMRTTVRDVQGISPRVPEARTQLAVGPKNQYALSGSHGHARK